MADDTKPPIPRLMADDTKPPIPRLIDNNNVLNRDSGADGKVTLVAGTQSLISVHARNENRPDSALRAITLWQVTLEGHRRNNFNANNTEKRQI
ncbi:hypothetical protein KUV95_05920 [Microbulbifer agarilyticus]|uniref:hypothetical protein n=1 Tax=Microbulbifer agarilyticus TaxID=260552 RepID=UPI001C9682B5|nr:hypothetical protein [Microbulbifer agarilyticus]MBY6211081.1 hypothetical protein [Microbulbifer agarilyticus]